MTPFVCRAGAAALVLALAVACSGSRSPSAPSTPGSATITATVMPNPLEATVVMSGSYQIRADIAFRETSGTGARITSLTTAIVATPTGVTVTETTPVDLSIPGGGTATFTAIRAFTLTGGANGALMRVTATGVDDRGASFSVGQVEAPVQIPGGLPVPPPAPGGVEGVIAGAGDIAICENANDTATALLLDGIPGTVFTAGDNAYDDGTAAEFQNCYEPTWGRHKARTRPSPGNHDYKTQNAAPYYAYFGANAGPPGLGYYSYNIGSWHIVSLNSNIAANPGSAQHSWLQSDLAATSSTCTLAYWHHALFSSGDHGNDNKMREIFRALHTAGADVVINGHDHNYERFAPQNPDAVADPARGIRLFVAGTGGKSLRPFKTIRANSEVRDANSYGVLKLTLRSASYDWEFIPVAGATFRDMGTGTCSPTGVDSPFPSLAPDGFPSLPGWLRPRPQGRPPASGF